MKNSITLFALAAMSSSSLGDVITQNSDYFWDVQKANAPAPLSFQAFDTMGGTRELTGVSVSLESFYSLEMIAENGENYAITANDWFVEAAVFNNLSFNGQSVFGLGSAGYGPMSVDLAAADGVEQFGDDSVFWSFKDSMSAQRDLQGFQMGAFIGSGEMEADIYPFLSLLIPPPAPFFDLWIHNHYHQGTIGLTYQYTTVPAPAGTALLFGAGFIGLRRRR